MGRAWRKKVAVAVPPSSLPVSHPEEKIPEPEAAVSRSLDIFTNVLVLDELLPHLSLRDILLLSSTSRDVCEAVRSNHQLSRRLRLSLTPRRKVSWSDLEVLPIRWKNCLLEVDGWSRKDLPRIQKLLANVTCLELVAQIDRKKKVKPILPTDLAKLILAAHGLKSLTFPAEILCRDLSVMFYQDFCAHLKNLNELSFSRLTDRFPTIGEILYGIQINGSSFSDWVNGGSRLDHLKATLKTLISLSPLNLTSFILQNIHLGRFHFHTRWEYQYDLSEDSACGGLWLSLLLAHKETLEKLDIDREIWREGILQHHVFPRLKFLKADSSEKGSEFVAEFIKNHPQLETILINGCKYYISDYYALTSGYSGGGKTVFDAVALQPSNLKNVRLVFPVVTTFSNRRQQFNSLPWDFLHKCGNLEKLHVDLYGDAINMTTKGFSADVSKILQHVPRGVKYLTISGVSAPRGRDAILPHYTLDMTQYIQEFTSLRTLDLTRSFDAVNDEILQAIVRACPHLRFLAFSDCDEVTDFGITGKKEDRNGTGIQSLSYLEELWILECPEISNSAYLESIAFSALRNLTLANFDSDSFSDAELMQLATQNPSLEYFRYANFMEPTQKTPLNKKLSQLGRIPFKFDELACDRRGVVYPYYYY